MGFPDNSVSKETVCNEGNLKSTPGSGRSLGEGNAYPLQYSCPGNPADGGAWWATAMGHTESGTTDHTGTHRNRLSSESLYS